MRSLSTVLSVCAMNFRKWRTDYRVWTIGITLVIMVCICVDELRQIAQTLGAKIPVWIFPFLYSGYYAKIIFTLPLVLLFCNAPFTDRNQIFVYTRTGRRKWLFGQILYIFFASAAYYVFLFAVTLLCTIFYGGAGADWGKTLGALSTGQIMFDGAGLITVSKAVVYFFTPISACAFTLLNSWLCGAVIGLLVFFLNSVTETRFAGILTAAVLVVATVLPRMHFPDLLKFSPVSWNTLDNIDVGGLTNNPSFTYCIAAYLIMLALLGTGILLLGGKNLDEK